jgi:hypothetical protein
MRKTTDALFGALIVVAFVVGCNWNKPKHTPTAQAPATIIDSVTVYVEKHDTIFLPIAVKTKPMRTLIQQGIKYIEVVKDSFIPCDDSLRTYNYLNKDSSVNVQTYVQGRLIRQVVNSRTPTTTIKVDKTPSFALYGNVYVSPISITPYVSIVRERACIGVGYDVINRTPSITYGLKLYSK